MLLIVYSLHAGHYLAYFILISGTTVAEGSFQGHWELAVAPRYFVDVDAVGLPEKGIQLWVHATIIPIVTYCPGALVGTYKRAWVSYVVKGLFIFRVFFDRLYM